MNIMHFILHNLAFSETGRDFIIAFELNEVVLGHRRHIAEFICLTWFSDGFIEGQLYGTGKPRVTV